MKKMRWTTLLVVAFVAFLILGGVGAGAASAAGPGDAGGPVGGLNGPGPLQALKEVARLLEMAPRDFLSALKDGKTIAELAGEKGVDLEAVIDTLVSPVEERTAALVDEGLLSQAQADELNARARERAEDVANLPFPYGLHGRGLETAATTIGISVDELIGELESGRSIAEVAEANGTSGDAVVDALVADREQSLQELVALDLMTETQAGIVVARYRKAAEQAVNRSRGAGLPPAEQPFAAWGPGHGLVPHFDGTRQRPFAEMMQP